MTSEPPPVVLGPPAGPRPGPAPHPMAEVPGTPGVPEGADEPRGSSDGDGGSGSAPSEPRGPIGVPAPPVTGDQAVDEAMELVSDTFGADPASQLQVYESAHRTLQDRLADVDG